MTFPREIAQRFARQILLAPVGGAGQIRLLGASVLLRGDAPLCATYLAAAGLGTLLVEGEPPPVASHAPEFRMERAGPGARADLVLDLGDGTPGFDLWGGAVGGRVLLGTEPRRGPPPDAGARALLETLAAGEVLWRLLGHEPHAYDFALVPNTR